jgi:hypothetical protein
VSRSTTLPQPSGVDSSAPEQTSTTPSLSVDAAALCPKVEHMGTLRAADITDKAAIADLVAALPSDYRPEAALFYAPYGGDIGDQDTSGVAAGAAGQRLYQFYKRVCDYDGP